MKLARLILFTLILFFVGSSCQKEMITPKYVKAEIVSYYWNLMISRPVSEHHMMFVEESKKNTRKTTTTTNSVFLNKISRLINEDLEACTSLCQIDIRVSIVLYDSENDEKPDTLSFGNIYKAKFNDKYYMLNEDLVKLILTEVDETHLKLFEDYYQDYTQ